MIMWSVSSDGPTAGVLNIFQAKDPLPTKETEQVPILNILCKILFHIKLCLQ